MIFLCYRFYYCRRMLLCLCVIIGLKEKWDFLLLQKHKQMYKHGKYDILYVNILLQMMLSTQMLIYFTYCNIWEFLILHKYSCIFWLLFAYFAVIIFINTVEHGLTPQKSHFGEFWFVLLKNKIMIVCQEIILVIREPATITN